MTESIIVTYEEADENFLMTLLNRIRVKTEVFETMTVAKTMDIDADANRTEILAAMAELDNKVYHKVTQEELYDLITH
jgi:arginine/lysine/ornithine decarboxylase